jgi:hypothetical protein
MPSNRERTHRKSTGIRKGRAGSFAVEPLEGRALLAVVYPVGISHPIAISPPPAPVAMTSRNPPSSRASGIVTEPPHFYQDYAGPRLQELEAMKASGELSSNGTFTFTGTNRGRITGSPAVYVWGIDRSGNLPAGPFENRPGIKFDAVVVVALGSSSTPSAKVVDIATGTTTDLPAGSSSIHGKTVSVRVPAGLLPSTGLAPSRYRFNYWPEDGGPAISTSVASFAPEFTTARVGSH